MPFSEPFTTLPHSIAPIEGLFFDFDFPSLVLPPYGFFENLLPLIKTRSSALPFYPATLLAIDAQEGQERKREKREEEEG